MTELEQKEAEERNRLKAEEQAAKDFNPFGEEWETEMKKWRKISLIQFLRKTLIELHELKIASSDRVDFSFTPENLLDHLGQLGAWSTYGLASSALEHYFPEEYKNGCASTDREVELLIKLGGKSWEDVIIKYHNEVGYTAQVLSNTDFVNAY